MALIKLKAPQGTALNMPIWRNANNTGWISAAGAEV